MRKDPKKIDRQSNTQTNLQKWEAEMKLPPEKKQQSSIERWVSSKHEN